MKHVLSALAAAALLAGSCTEGHAAGDTAAVMAATLQRVVAQDNTFGEGHRFTVLLVLTSLDPAAGTAVPGGEPGRALSAKERRAIEESLARWGPPRWIDAADEWRTADLMPVVAGSVILGVGEPTFDSRGALVPFSLWCGGVCGLWATYRLALQDGEWVVLGIEGGIFIA